MNFTIGKKLGLVFGLLLLLMSISSVITYTLTVKTEKIQNNVVNLRMKTVLLGKDVINGINQSLAALRGYMILGYEPIKAQAMKDERLGGWNVIEHAIKEYEVLSKNWTVPENVQRLNKIATELDAFKAVQKKIEDISHSNENIPSYELLLSQAAPRAMKMLTSITAIIDEEAGLSATKDRKALLKNLADTRGSFAVGLANIRAYLLSGEQKFKTSFEQKWNINEASTNTINTTQKSLFSPSQLQNWQNFSLVRNEFKTLPQQMFSLRSADDWNKANYWLGTKAAPSASKILSLLKEMKTSQDIESAEGLVQTLKTTLIVITLISLILGVICAVLFSRDLLTRLKTILTRAKAIADGDMSGQALIVVGTDELADLTTATNQMSKSLLTLVQKTADSMVEASKGTSEILNANEEMALGVNQQTLQMEQIATAIEELSNSSLDVAKNCIEASDSSVNTLNIAKDGGQLVKDSLTQMVAIKAAFDQSSSAISSLSSKNKEIEDILGVIKGIADQTNLLALNAAIEAARAGEQGRGFAVVADEVRQLASRTTTATAEVEAAILNIRQETDVAVTMMAQGSSKVDHGVDLSDSAASSLNDIIGSVDEVVARIQTIAATAEEQSMTISEIAKNTENVSTASQQLDMGISNVVALSNTVTQNTEAKAKELRSMV